MTDYHRNYYRDKRAETLRDVGPTQTLCLRPFPHHATQTRVREQSPPSLVSSPFNHGLPPTSQPRSPDSIDLVPHPAKAVAAAANMYIIF